MFQGLSMCDRCPYFILLKLLNNIPLAGQPTSVYPFISGWHIRVLSFWLLGTMLLWTSWASFMHTCICISHGCVPRNGVVGSYGNSSQGPSSKGYGFSCGLVWMWELDCEEGWVPKNWCFWTMVLEKTMQSLLDFTISIITTILQLGISWFIQDIRTVCF